MDVFIGIAGANWGLVNCYYNSNYRTCNDFNGFWPGQSAGGLSKVLYDLNKSGIKEGDKVFAMMSDNDEVLGYGSKVWGRYTPLWTEVDDSKVYHSLGHYNMRDAAEDQYRIITDKKIPFKSESEIISAEVEEETFLA